MWEYANGNYIVRILDDGTKIRLSNNPVPEFPESIDVKITNRCNGGCLFCHEKSTPDGAHFDVDDAYRLFSELPSGVELAFGGGNPLECKQDLNWLFRKLKGQIKNITVNSIHLDQMEDIYPNAIGISYRRELHEKIKDFTLKRQEMQTVIHLIVGVHTLDDLKKCLEDFDRILILGFKQFGRGSDFYNETVEQRISEWKSEIWRYLQNTKKIIVFDNLALTQLGIKRLFSTIRWNELYMGDDGQFTMYIDLVKKEFAASSVSKRLEIGSYTIKEMFAIVRSNYYASKE